MPSELACGYWRAGTLPGPNRPMRVLVFGAGAIGCFLGHRLVQSGHSVTLVGRPALVTAVRQHGLSLSGHSPRAGAHSLEGVVSSKNQPDSDSYLSDFSVVWPQAVVSLSDTHSEERNWDLVLLTVKVYDTDEASRTLAPFLTNATPVLLVQNGVGGEELAAQALPGTSLISGVLTMSVSMEEPGRIRQETSSGGLNIAPVQPDRWPAASEALRACSGLRVAVYGDYRSMKWSKLLLNLLANAVPAILDMTPGETYRTPAVFGLEREAFLEALRVMRTLGLEVVDFRSYPVKVLVWAMQYLPASLLRPLMTRLVASGRGDKKPSLQLDLARGRKQSEVRYLNGAVAAQGARLNIATPVNSAIVETLLGLVDGRLSWDEYRRRPEKLITAIHR